MRFLVFVTVLLGAQLVREANAKLSLMKMFGLKANEIESVFGLKIDDIEKKVFGLSLKEVKKTLESKSLSIQEVLDVLNRASDDSEVLYSGFTIADFIRISKKDLAMCNIMGLRRVLSLFPTHNKVDFGPSMRDNMNRYCRAQFNGLFEYCQKETNGQAFTERLRNLQQESSNAAENLILNGMNKEDIMRRLNRPNVIPALTRHLLESALDDSAVISDQYTIKDFRLTIRKNQSMCTLDEFKRRIVMYHGSDPSMDSGSSSPLKNNLAAFCRLQFNELVEYCLRVSQRGDFKEKIELLYRVSENNKQRKYEATLLTTMESMILRMPAGN